VLAETEFIGAAAPPSLNPKSRGRASGFTRINLQPSTNYLPPPHFRRTLASTMPSREKLAEFATLP